MESPPTFLAPDNIAIEDFAPPHSSSAVGVQDHSFLSPLNENHDYNFTGTYDDSSAQSGQDETTDDEMARLNGAATTSSRSSISSLPASVAASAMIQPPDAITPTKSHVGEQGLKNVIPPQSPEEDIQRIRGSPFRHPSSVRAMQMRDDDDFSLAHRRRDSQMTGRMSNFSGRSSNTSSPSKRRVRGSQSSPTKQSKLKKEYPLVLLHCTLLPPTVSVPGVSVHNATSLADVLPEDYWRRWKLLNDRVSGSEIQTRGVLIPHPKGDYDLLEERLLESLELSQPRIRSGHYVGDGEEEAERSETDEEDTEQGSPCPDCGRKVISDLNRDRKWEIKVYAANGLMRAGAWSAAWSEMEKIDVEVGVWLPEHVRRDVEAALQEQEHMSAAAGPNETSEADKLDDREREIYGASGKFTQDDIDGLNDRDRGADSWPHRADTRQAWANETKLQSQEPVTEKVVVYLRAILDDKKNAAIVFLGVLVLWLALLVGPGSQTTAPSHTSPVVSPETVISTSTFTTTTTVDLPLSTAVADSVPDVEFNTDLHDAVGALV